MAMAIKICGLTDEASIHAAIAARVDYVGFISFPPSPRHLSFAAIASLRVLLPVTIQPVVVMVDPDDALIAQAKTITPAYIQLHGNETPERIASIKKMAPQCAIAKAIAIRSADDVAKAKPYESCADMLLFDAKPPLLTAHRGEELLLPGGNGLTFDWNLLKGHAFTLPWMLSGGLNANNVAQAIRQSGARMVDVSSGVERAPGVKDPALIHAFAKAARDL